MLAAVEANLRYSTRIYILDKVHNPIELMSAKNVTKMNATQQSYVYINM